MPNFASAVKAEIVRLARKELKSQVNPLKSSNIILKKMVSELKKKVATLESENKRFSAILKDKKPDVPAEDLSKARITSKSLIALRKKLGLSQDSLAKLIGVSGQAVYANEHKSGRLRLRPATLTNILSLKGIGKREAKRRLEELNR